MSKRANEEYSDEEAARRRDEVVRRMANTPPQPRPSVLRPPEKGMKAESGLEPRKKVF